MNEVAERNECHVCMDGKISLIKVLNNGKGGGKNKAEQVVWDQTTESTDNQGWKLFYTL